MPFLRRFLILAFALFPLLVVASAQAAITARVTYQSHAAYLANGNSAPGALVFRRSPGNGDQNNAVGVAWLELNGNVSNLPVDLGTTPGWFTVTYMDSGAMQARGCTTSPLSFFNFQYLADGQSIDITITCTMPDNTPPTLVSAATSTNGSQVILNWSEAIDYYGNGEDFRLYQSGTLRTITAASYAGSQLSLTVSPAINAGTTVTLDYVDNGNLYDYAGNPPANFSGRPVTNNVSGGLPPNVTDARISIAGATGNGGVFRRGDSVTASWNNTASGDNNSGVTAVSVDFSQFGGGAAVAATNSAGTWTATSAVAAGITASNRNVSITASNSNGSTTRADTSNATVDSVVPTVVSIAPAAGALPTNTTVNFTASFSEAVTGVSTDDFTLVGTGSATGSIASASGSGSSYTVTVNGITGNGTLKLNLNASTNISDTAGNSGLAAFTAGTTHTVAIATAPGAPTIGTATAGDAQASVSFSAPASNGGSAITGYTVTSNPGGITAGGNGFTTSPITLSGLSNGTAYTFTVTATNAVGTSTASAASNSVTPKANQTITFSNPGAQNFGTTPTLSATASSGLPVSLSSATTGVCTITSGGTLTFITAGSCTINADQAGNAATNAATTISQSFLVNAVAPGAPVIGTATAGNTQASVSFSAPVNTGGSSITGYTVTANPGGATASGAASPLVVSGLSNGQAYTFTVTATNVAGTGPASAASNAVTPAAPQVITFANPGAQNFGTTPTLTASADSNLPVSFTSATPAVCTITSGGLLGFASTGSCTIHADQPGNASYLPAPRISRTFSVNGVVPGAPTIGTATVAGASAVSVGFSAPLFDGGAAITGYTVISSPGGLTATGAGSPITVTGLTPGTSYTFVVTATNANGTGAASAPSNAVTPVPPLAVAPVSATVAYGTASPISLAITGAASSVAVATAPAHGTAVASGTTITYTPAPGYAGSDSFSYTASDAYTTTAAATVSITVSAPTVMIDTASLAVATADSAYTQTLSSSGGASPYRYALSSGALPAGLSLSASGTLSGTPMATGTFAFDVTSTDSSTGTGPFSATRSYTLQVDAPLLAVAPVSATIGYGAGPSPVSLAITGVASSVAVVSAPAHGSAVASGTTITYTPAPGHAGPDSFSYTASDAYTTTAAATVSITVSAPSLSLTTSTLPAATGSAAYAQTLAASGGSAPYRYALSSGALPPGLVLASDGSLGGTPTQAGSFAFAITVTDSSTGTGPFTATQGYVLVVGAPVLTVDPLPAATGGQAYRVQLSAQGGAAPYAFSVGAGTLPPGLVLSASGEVSGIPTAAGSYEFSLQVADANGFTTTQAFTQVVDAGSQLIQAFVATPEAPVFAPGGTFALSASGGASGNPVVFASLTPTVCQVQGSTVTMLTAGQCSLSADQAGNATYQAAAQVRLDVAIALATPELGWIDDISKVYGEDAFELPEPQSSSPGTFSFSSSDPAVATVSGRTVTLVGEGVTVLTATQAATANYTAAAIQVRLLVSARPNPAADPRVASGLQAQVDASMQFAQIQSGNIRDRLRQVRGGSVSNDFRFALTQAGGQGVPGLTLPKAAADSVMPRLPEGWGMWVAGSASFGRSGRTGLAGGADFSSRGLTVGIDHAVDEQVLLGMAGSWARQDTDLDSSSSRLDADQRSLAVYGLWRVGGNLFVDGMLANGWLDFDSVRWNDLAQGSAQGQRSGQQWFGSLTFGHERHNPAGMALTSYGRYDWHRATLDGYSESGLGAFDLVYGRQRVVNNALALGVQGSFQLTRDWGSLRPHWTVEYRSALDNRGQATINYVMRPAASDYVLDLRSYNDDLLSLGAGMDLQLDSGWLFSLLLGHERGSASMRSSSIGLQLRYGSGAAPMQGNALGLLPAQPGQCDGQLTACPVQGPLP
ncbi:autotransporter domain-containing protein [Stenotrophomonas ginsengisoli]|uniref:autotransporter domain-containing protein n=1 Tax=Stenotrophomonas ginsengisoli TaxID=336566 RepID=UPI00070C99B5|nr:autotransporter domain-containing protein [Stenotrophomonas ginsengisoli]